MQKTNTKLKALIASILPGIFLIGYNVGTGSITSMSKAGANFGLDLLWTVLISCLTTYYLINLFSKYTMVTSKTIIQGIKEDIHPALAIILITALSAIIVSALIGVLGIISEVLKEWSQTTLGQSLSTGAYAAIVGVVLYLLLWFGNYSSFEKILAVLVSIMGIAFLTTMFINFPNIKELTNGLVPKIPESANGSDNNPLIIVSGMVGTTVSVFAFVIRSQIVKGTQWTMADYKIQKRDAIVSASMMFFISAAVMITASSTLHLQGLKMNNVVEMIPLLEPLAGKGALIIFVLGILAAGLSSHLPNLLVIPWLIIDYKNQERDTQTKSSRLILLALTVLSILGVALGFKPVFILMLSQACIAIVLPITIASIFYLTNKEQIMNSYKNSTWDKVLLTLIMIFALYMSSLGVQGLIEDLSKI